MVFCVFVCIAHIKSSLGCLPKEKEVQVSSKREGLGLGEDMETKRSEGRPPTWDGGGILVCQCLLLNYVPFHPNKHYSVTIF